MNRFLPVVLCAVVLPIFASNTTSERHLTLRRDGDRLLILDDRLHTVIASAPAATTHRVVIAGTADRNDTLTLDLSQPITLPGGIDYDGGARGFDSLELRGGSLRNQHVTQLTPHDGVIELDGLVLRYTNLEPITDTVAAANFTINGTAGLDTVTFTDGPPGHTTVSSPTFESVTFANKTNVVFDGMGGGDTVSINNPAPAAGLVSLIVRNVATVTHAAPVRYPRFGVSATSHVGLAAFANDVDFLEVATQNGFVAFTDVDDLTIGGVDAALSGINVATNGFIQLRLTDGSLTLSDTDGATAILQAGSLSGDVFIRMPEINNNLTIDVDRDAILAPAGTISVEAGGSIFLGTGGAAFSNDVRGAGTVFLAASISVVVEGSTRVAADDFGTNTGGILSVRGFGLVEVGGTATVGTAGTTGAPTAVLTGGNGALNLVGSNPAALFSTSGYVRITTWDLAIGAASGVTAPDRVRIETFFLGNNVVLGPATDDSNLGPEISDAEIDRIFSPIVQLLPSANIYVTQPITFTTGTELILEPGASFIGSGTGSLSAQTLTFRGPLSSAGTWTITDSVLLEPHGAAVPYLGVTTLNAAGSVHRDVFFVTPHPTTTIHVDGHLPTPPDAPGDTLDFDLAGVTNPALAATPTPEGYQGTLTSANRAPVQFEHIETVVGAPVDLQIAKSDSAAADVAGTTITYTITVSNPTGIEVVSASVADTFPAAVTGVAWTCAPGAGSICGGAGNGDINDLATLGPNSSVTYTATGTISPSASGTLTNTATVTTPAAYLETNPANNSATDSTTLAAEADLALTKTSSGSLLAAGGDITYTIALRNTGPSDAQSVVLTDMVPANTTFRTLSAPAGYSCTTPAVGGTGTVTCTIATLPPSATDDTFLLTVRVDDTAAIGTVISNTATATSATEDTTPNTATAAVTVSASPAGIPALSPAMLALLAATLAAGALMMMKR